MRLPLQYLTLPFLPFLLYGPATAAPQATPPTSATRAVEWQSQKRAGIVPLDHVRIVARTEDGAAYSVEVPATSSQLEFGKWVVTPVKPTLAGKELVFSSVTASGAAKNINIVKCRAYRPDSGLIESGSVGKRRSEFQYARAEPGYQDYTETLSISPPSGISKLECLQEDDSWH